MTTIKRPSKQTVIAILWVRNRQHSTPVHYHFKHESGRLFGLAKVGDAGNENYFVYEQIPTGAVVNAQGEARANDTLERLVDSPNDFYQTARQMGLEASVCTHGGGLAQGMILYSTLDDANQAVWAAIERNTWLLAYSAPRVIEAQFEARREAVEASRRYTESLIERFEKSKASAPALLKGAGQAMASDGKKSHIAMALLSFRNDPSVATWNDIARRMILPDATTGWQLWSLYDAKAPHSLPTNDQGESEFNRYPDADAFLGWLRDYAEEKLASLYRRLDELNTETEQDNVAHES